MPYSQIGWTDRLQGDSTDKGPLGLPDPISWKKGNAERLVDFKREPQEVFQAHRKIQKLGT